MTRRVDLDLGEATRWNSGISSILDEEHRAIVEEIWDELDGLGMKAARSIPEAHFSYQVGDYDTDALLPLIERVAATTAPFTVRTAGLGIFGGAQPVLYLPVVRTEQLSTFHRILWGAVGSACRNAAEFYWLEEWVPHVTLAAEDVAASTLARAAEVLGTRALRWTVDIDNLAYFEAGYEGHELRARFPLGG